MCTIEATVRPSRRTRSGAVDRRAEVVAFVESDAFCDAEGSIRVVRASAVGAVVYVAVRSETEDGGVGACSALVVRTKLEAGTLLLRVMEEGDEGCDCSCPECVLEALSPTESDRALEWRRRCRRDVSEKRNRRNFLSNLKPGMSFSWTPSGADGTTECVKYLPPAAAGMKSRWLIVSKGTVVRVDAIPQS